MTRDALTDFANAVLDRCSAAPEEFRFHRKTFIAALRPSKVTARMLIEAHVAGLLVLSRCDLVSAFDDRREVVAASEILHPMGASFHFVEAPR